MKIFPREPSVDLGAELEPTDADLAALLLEEPVIDAELELLDAQLAFLDRRPSELERQQVRRLARRVLAERLVHYTLTQIEGLAVEFGAVA